MKRKLILIFLVLTFVLIFLPKTALAANKDFEFFSVNVPENYTEKVVKNTDIVEHIDYNDNENNINIGFSVYKNTSSNIFTKQHLENAIERAWKNYYGSPDKFETESISGELVELNGLTGYYMYINVKEKDTGLIHTQVNYRLKSDNYEINIHSSCEQSFFYSQDYKKIVNSFRIKDTVLKNNGIPYIDVPSNAWYFEDVKYTYNNKLITGYNSNTFGPNDKITRAMVVTILYRMEGNPTVTGNSKFKDVKQNVWYSNAIKWATDKGVVHGYNSEKFGPNDNITRQDLMVILRNYAKYKKKDTNITMDLSKYSDTNKISPYAKSAVEWAVKKGILVGSNGKLNPQGTATRAEMAAFIHRYCIKFGR